MGVIFDTEGDKQQGYQYHFDSYRYFPSNLDVIDWLGSYFIEMQVSEKAIGYFERAALMQPDDVKWQLMIASCYRRSVLIIFLTSYFISFVLYSLLPNS